MSLRITRDTGAWGLRYAHQRLRIRDGAPASNGYLHQFDARYAWSPGPLEVALETGVHGSSNLFRHGRLHRDAWVTTFAAWHTLPERPYRIGLAGDYRFGGFRMYPRLALEREFAAGDLELDLPVRIAWHAGEGVRWSVALERDGEKWGTLDGDRDVRDKLYLREWRAGGTLDVPAGWRDARLEFGAGLAFGTRVTYRDLDHGRRDARLADRAYAQVGLRW